MDTSEALAKLDATGIDVDVLGPQDIAMTVEGRHVLATVRTTQTRPTPSMIARDTRHIDQHDDPARLVLYIVDRLSPGLAATAIRDPRIAVVSREEVIINGEYRHPLVESRIPPARPTTIRRPPWGRFAVMRVLLRSRHPRTQQQLAHECGVTQAAVSGILRNQLDGLVRREQTGWTTHDPEAVWVRFITDYVGPGGITTAWLGKAPITVQARRAQQQVPDALLSGDVAADVIAPWRVPRKATIYSPAGARLSSAGLAETTNERATLHLVVPADQTIWRTAGTWATSDSPIADPLIVAKDVLHSGGPDADEAVDRLRRRTLDLWATR